MLTSKIKCYLYLAAFIVLSTFAAGTYYHIKSIGVAEEKIRNYESRVDSLNQLMEENKRLARNVKTLQSQLNERHLQINDEAFKLKESKANEADTLLSNHISGVERLSIPVITTRQHTSDTRTRSSTDPRRPQGTERHELHPATAQFIIELTKRADRYTAERNQCVQLLNETHKQVNEYQAIIQQLQKK